MSRVNLADLATGRVPLAPREAATLTLAVAREWDRQRALHGPTDLPQLAAIELTDTGTVAFLVVSPCDTDSRDAVALSHLLAQLLRFEDDSSTLLPGELLITIRGRSGRIDRSSDAPDGFRTALARFADEEPHALRALYWRTVTARSREGRHRPRRTAAPLPQKERRATSAQVTELRRAIRKLEQRVFEWSQEPDREPDTAPVARPAGPGSPGPGRARPMGRWLTTRAAVAAALVLLVTSGITLGGVLMLQDDAATTPPVQAATTVTPVVADADTTVTPASTTPGTAVATTPVRTVRAATVTRAASRTRVQTVRKASTQAPQKHSATFAGGTRGIAWLAP